MIRAIPAALLLASCQSVTPVVCPEPMVIAVICPDPMEDYYDKDFRRELADDLSAFPEYAALSKAARSYLAIAKKCERTL